MNSVLNELSTMGYLTKSAIIIIILVTSLLLYSGILHRIVVKTGRTPFHKLIIAYKFGIGDTRVAHKSLNEIKNLTPDLPRVTITYNGAIYQKDSRKCETFAIGVVVSVNAHPVWLNHLNTLRTYGYEFAELPGTDHAVLSSFPHCNYLSVCLASFKVLPLIGAYIKKHNLCAHPVLALIDDTKMQFVVPLAWQFDYYVPEAKRFYNMLNIQEQIVIRATPQPPPLPVPRRERKKRRTTSTSSSTSSTSSPM